MDGQTTGGRAATNRYPLLQRKRWLPEARLSQPVWKHQTKTVGTL